MPAVSRSNLNLIEKRIYKPPLQCRQRVGSEIALYCVTYCTVALLIHDKRTDSTTVYDADETKNNNKNVKTTFEKYKKLATAVNTKIYTWIVCYFIIIIIIIIHFIYVKTPLKAKFLSSQITACNSHAGLNGIKNRNHGFNLLSSLTDGFNVTEIITWIQRFFKRGLKVFFALLIRLPWAVGTKTTNDTSYY